MFKDICYEVLIIGGGISSCVFASSHIKNGFMGKIAIIENGRNLGGRSSTRKSLTNKGWELNHGSPNINICNTNNNNLINNFIKELLNADIIQSDNSELIELHGDNKYKSNINFDFYKGENYISKSSMSELAQNIISLNNFRNQIDYYFETLITKLEFINDRWILTSKTGKKFKTKFLICSSNLLLHKRSLNIFKTNQIPIRKAIPINREKKIDSIINLLNKQSYIIRLTFLIYTKSNYSYRDNYKNKFRYFLLNNQLEDEFKFERIIFQKQKNNNLGIVIHTKNINLINDYFHSQNENKFKEKVVFLYNNLFDQHPLINKLIDYESISIMIWRASQPWGFAIPENLQVSESHNIGFCGDWFNLEGFGRMEGAILSALKLSHKINLLG